MSKRKSKFFNLKYIVWIVNGKWKVNGNENEIAFKLWYKWKEWETSTLFEIKEFYIETRFKYVISVPSKLIGVRWQS